MLLYYVKTLLAYVSALGVAGILLLLILSTLPQTETAPSGTPVAIEYSDIMPQEYPGSQLSPASAPATTSVTKEEEEPAREPEFTTPAPSPAPAAPVEEADTTYAIARIENPYSHSPLSIEALNLDARATLVNIFCTMQDERPRAMVGSGILIDPRGVILTNAHVAQYVLLSEDPRVSLSCSIRQGSPARSLWRAEVLYIPPAWIEGHAKDISEEHTKGTGEHDYALLRITESLNDTPLPSIFPALPPDTREAIGFLGDPVLAASYPAEFLKSAYSQPDLYPLISTATIEEFLTFKANTIDLISIGGIASAQGGSSGGGVINAWGRLIGIITTTSEGETTAERDLRAITMNYIDRALVATYGANLASLLSGDVAAKAADFRAHSAPQLINLLIEEITN